MHNEIYVEVVVFGDRRGAGVIHFVVVRANSEPGALDACKNAAFRHALQNGVAPTATLIPDQEQRAKFDRNAWAWPTPTIDIRR